MVLLERQSLEPGGLTAVPISPTSPGEGDGPSDIAAGDGSEEKLESEVRRARKYSMSDAIGRLAGPGSLKGASPVSPQQQAENEIRGWLGSNVEDAAGALRLVLARNLAGSQILLDDLDRPLTVLGRYCERVVASEPLLHELVREADVEWARLMDERPHFERPGGPAHADDPYTIDDVRRVLARIAEDLRG